jgi:tetratricopeptide (TPR) repeat protein
MGMKAYWGEGGQFGPFDTQDDGWPNAGQVMRYFRDKMGITAKAFGKLYGKEIREDKKPISERWILEMELENKVPIDITRRRIIASLLGVPPILFGLASLQDVPLQQPQETHTPSTVVAHSHVLHKTSVDISKQAKNIHVALQLHRTSNAQGLLQDINADIRDLESAESQTQGDLRYRVGELLVSNHLLATKIVKDQKQYAHAYMYANNAVRAAKNLGDDELIVAAKYTRGCTRLEWGLFGFMKRGKFQVDRDKVTDAIQDFEDILGTARSRQDALHPQLQGLTMLQLGRAQSILKHAFYDVIDANALSLADQAADMVGHDTIDDPYTRIIVTGTLSGLHWGGYHLVKAGIFSNVGLPGKAINELNQLKRLTQQTYGRDETRNQAWSDIALAEALIGLKEYQEAVSKLKDAFVTCYTINSTQNIAMIRDIYSRFSDGPYGMSREVKELGEMLGEWSDQ